MLGVTYPSQRPAWSQWNPGRSTFDPYEVPDELIRTWRQTEPGQPGYNSSLNCYCWGYRPADRPKTLDGVHWANQQTSWKICQGACPTPTCPPPMQCPVQTCPTHTCHEAPPCPSCPRCPECVQNTFAVLDPIKKNTNWLWLAGFGFAVVATYGVRRTLQMRRK